MGNLTGWAAIDAAERDERVALRKYADPVEDARTGLSVQEARAIAQEDPGLIWADEYVGPIRVIDGHPVPYSGTVQRERTGTGEWESVPAASVLSVIEDWLRANRPGQTLLRIDDAYFYYGREK